MLVIGSPPIVRERNSPLPLQALPVTRPIQGATLQETLYRQHRLRASNVFGLDQAVLRLLT